VPIYAAYVYDEVQKYDLTLDKIIKAVGNIEIGSAVFMQITTEYTS